MMNLGLFPGDFFFLIINKVPRIFVYKSFCAHWFLLPWGKYLGVQLLNHIVGIGLAKKFVWVSHTILHSMFNLKKKFPNCFQRVVPFILHSHQQDMRDPSSPQLFQHSDHFKF